MGDEVDERLYAALDEAVDEYIDDSYNNIVDNRTKEHRKRAYIERNREEGHARQWNDYFSENPTFPSHLFRRCFRMNKTVFMQIVDSLSQVFPFFQHRRGDTGRKGLSSLQKCTAALRMLAYGWAADAVDEYLCIAESTTLSCLSNFTEGVIQLFGDEYLRRPTLEDLQRLLDIGEVCGFPGMIGSIDCMHWEWKNCPTAWKGQYTRGSGKPTIVLEAVASQDLWIWHTFFGLPGPEAEKFAKVQESTRKDVERAFGVLQARFAIVKNPAVLWDKAQIGMIMQTCVILHNMIVEDERNGYAPCDISQFEEGTSSRSSQVDMPYARKDSNLRTMLKIRSQIRDPQTHEQLKYDLIQNIWNKFGNDEDV